MMLFQDKFPSRVRGVILDQVFRQFWYTQIVIMTSAGVQLHDLQRLLWSFPVEKKNPSVALDASVNKPNEGHGGNEANRCQN